MITLGTIELFIPNFLDQPSSSIFFPAYNQEYIPSIHRDFHSTMSRIHPVTSFIGEYQGDF